MNNYLEFYIIDEFIKRKKQKILSEKLELINLNKDCIYMIFNFLFDSDVNRLVLLNKSFNNSIIEYTSRKKNLNITGKKINDYNFYVLLSRYQNITSLSARMCDLSTLNYRSLICYGLNIKYLNLSYNFKITDEFFIGISVFLKNLEYLNINCCKNVTNQSLKYLGLNCKKLNYLNISFCYKITGKSIEALTLNVDNLESLHIDKCSRINGLCIENIFRNLNKKLHDFSCSSYYINDSTLNKINLCYNLESLFLYDCIFLSDDGIENISNCKNLKELKLKKGNSIFGKGFNKIFKHCTKLEVVYIIEFMKINDKSLKINGQNIKNICIDRCNISENCINYFITNCVNLQNLELKYINYNKNCLINITKSTSIKELSLLDISKNIFTDDIIKILLKSESLNKIFLNNYFPKLETQKKFRENNISLY